MCRKEVQRKQKNKVRCTLCFRLDETTGEDAAKKAVNRNCCVLLEPWWLSPCCSAQRIKTKNRENPHCTSEKAPLRLHFDGALKQEQ